MLPSMSSSSKTRSRTGSASQVSDRADPLRELSDTNETARPASSMLADKKPQSNGFRLFGKQSSTALRSKAMASENTDAFMPSTLSNKEVLRAMIKPCPLMKPLENKLQARHEPSVLARPALDHSSEQGISAITIARRRGETAKKLTARASDEDLGDIQEEEEGIQADAFFGELAGSSKNRSTIQAEEIERIARKVAPEPFAASFWSYYIQCYAKGQFNILDPPDPPVWGPNFEYLPAVKPPNEDRRMALSRAYDILWPAWTREKSGALLRAAMGKFDTHFASFSIFDDSNELFKAENGFNQPEIDREMSIGAHVLYTNEVLVLLDTEKDWRFAGNPLVKGIPCIRFFAGAPLLSDEGLVVGVFAVWSKEPRTSFSPDERRELAEFSALVMTDLTLQVTRLRDPDLHGIPSLQKEDLAYAPFQAESPEESLIDLDAATNFGSGLMPPALRYHRSTSPPMPGHYTGSPTSKNGHLLNHTPPPSREKEDDNLMIDGETRDFSEHNASSLILDSSFHGMAQLSTFQEIQDSTPRPFSSSDLTSLHPLPPNTPDRSLVDGELSHHPNFDFDQFPSIPDLSEFDDSQDFSTSSDIRQRSNQPSAENLNTTTGFLLSAINTDTECSPSESEKSFVSNASTPVLPVNPQRSEIGTSMASERWVQHKNTLEKRPSKLVSSPQGAGKSVPLAISVRSRGSRSSIQRIGTSYNVSDGISPSWESSEAAKHAAFACSRFAQKLGYDLVYVVEIKPARPGMSDEDLLKPGGLTKRILVAYGLDKPLNLSSETHLRILRCGGSDQWDNRGEVDLDQHYRRGCLISVLADTRIPRTKRDSGLVMGAFSHSRRIQKNVGSDQQTKALADFSVGLKQLLLKKPERKPVKRSMTESASPTTNPYPANEATELRLDDEHHHVSKYSLDSRHTRRHM